MALTRAASRRQLAEQVRVCRRRPSSDAPQTVQRLTALASAPVDREPAAWETNAAGPFLTIGNVAVAALGKDRFPDHVAERRPRGRGVRRGGQARARAGRS